MTVFKGISVANDEIFILILIVVCVGSLAALEVHSRRKNKATFEPEAPSPQEGPGTMEPPSPEPVPSKNANQLHGVALRRELITAGFLGAGCGAVIGAAVWGWKGAPMVAAVIMLTVAMTVTRAALLGVALPGALRALRRDPRIAAGPIVLALTDFLALIFYFNVARWLLE
jgi:hypothetical protein